MKPILAVLFAAALAWTATPAEYSLDATQYLDHIKFLASDDLAGRGTGFPGIDKAATYITRYFKKNGLSAPPHAGYLQPFGVTLNARLGPKNELELHTGKGTDKLKIKTDFIPYPFSSSGSFSGDLVFVGYGITAKEYNYDDYAGIDVKDKIVAVLRHEPQEYDESSIFAGRVYTEHSQIFSKASNAKLHGARAVLFVNEPSHHGGNDQLEAFTVDAGPANAGIGFAQIRSDELDRLLAAAGHTSAELVDAIDKDLKPRSFALPPAVNAKLEIDIARERKTANNVVAYLPGETDEYVILGAHYDHLGLGGSGSLAPSQTGTPHHGADDNASGTAGVLELARYFASRPKLKRGLLFMTFAGEELGLLGSSYWANNPELPLAKAVAMINMDMIGRIRDGKVTLGGVGTGSTLKEIIAQAATKTDLKLEVGDQTGYGSSDHMSFTIKQIPVLFFFSGLHADYHKPSDTWDKINAPDAVKLLATVANVTTALAQAPDRPVYVRATEVRGPSADPHQSGSDPGGISTSGGGYGPNFGSIPDFDEPPTGVRFADVRDGTPAAKAGLKAKDIMIEFDGKTIGNLYDFTYALRAKKPGDKVHVKVLRDGKPFETDVLLEERR